MGSRRRRALLWLAAPLAICLPCLLPFIAGAVLTGVGVGAVGSFFSDNALLLAAIAGFATVAVLLTGLGVSRASRRVRRSVRIFSKGG